MRTVLLAVASLFLLTACPWIKPDPVVSRSVKIDRFVLTECKSLSLLPEGPVSADSILKAAAEDQLRHEECIKKHRGAVAALRESLDIIEK